ncbi:MAG TPA: FG-GAP-like repeat-containing protein, partial [Gammaproteobacteria bacterium]
MNFPRIAALVASPGRRILVALFLVLGWVMPAQAALGFAPALNYGVQLDPAAVADGDFNGDGKVDLVVANKGSDSFSILLGNGNGTFETPLNYAIGSSGRDPVSIATGDFNGDSRLDLAVACSSSDNVIIFLNNGNNIFSGVVRDVGVMPVSVAAGDLNGDGNLDLAVANLFSDNISILLGYGNGTFTTAVNYGTGDGPDGVAVADLNGDGRLDLAVANVLGDNVSILLGSSNGTFGGGSSQAAGDMPYGVAVADLNGDGKTDLAVANELSDNVSILLNNGSTWGILAAAVNYGAGDGPTSVMAADFNGDGKVDLAVANDLSDNVSFLLGNGNGTFAAPISYGAGDGPRSVAQADFNGDGKPDLAVANSNSNSVSILLNMSNISYTMNATSGADGTITPPTQTVNYGSTAAFTLTPDTGYHIDAISGCGGTLAGNIYTTAPITADCTVSASFTLNTYTVRAFANDGGIIAPSPQTISYGYTVELYVYPNTGYSLEAVTGTCGGSLVGNTYTTAPITVDCTVIANFMPSYTVSTTSGVGGTISPPSQIVSFLSTASFAVTPDTGYSIGAVSGCGGTLSGNTYTTDAITGACTVAASFTLNSYTVSASAGEGGTLTPATQTINHGSTATFTVTPAADTTAVMGGSCGGSLAGNSYTTAPITGDCSVTA